MSNSRLLLHVNPHAKRYLWAGLILAVIISMLLVFNAGSVSSNVKSFLPSTENYGGNGTALFGGDGKVAKKAREKGGVNNSTLGFEKIFAISLPERLDHRDGLLLASKVSKLDIDLVDGVHGDAVANKTLPAKYNHDLGLSVIGAWRAHVNAISEVVRQDLGSALIMEDDVDWDVRIKSILHDFALSTHALLSSDTKIFSFAEISSTIPRSHSPYGDGWDVLWLGHCQMHLPPNGIITHTDDPTVPEAQHLRSFVPDEVTPLAVYPPHTRAVFHGVAEGTCSLAYAVTQPAARRILFDIGMEKLSDPFDLMLRGWCEKKGNVCFGVLPQLFDHYRRAGAADVDSDISVPHEKGRTKAFTNNIRQSVRMNMGRLVRGEEEIEDQYPDSS